ADQRIIAEVVARDQVRQLRCERLDLSPVGSQDEDGERPGAPHNAIIFVLSMIPAQIGEAPWVCRRLQPLRDWGHETGKEVLPRGAGAGGSDGVRARERVLLAVGCHPVYCRKDRLLW